MRNPKIDREAGLRDHVVDAVCVELRDCRAVAHDLLKLGNHLVDGIEGIPKPTLRIYNEVRRNLRGGRRLTSDS